jgi:protein-S-isoprenylcysteine O-methyltransferase Ste14
MARLFVLLYGVVSYFIFFITFLYAVGFVGNLIVPKSIDSGATASFGASLIINIILLSIFAIQHSVMARPAFKEWWTQIIPPVIERSTYVLLSSLALILLYWLWQPMNGVIWEVTNPFGQTILWALFLVGWIIVLLSTFLINHFDLFGLRQVYLYVRGKEYTHIDFRMPLLYKIVRHPIMLGFVIAFWATPYMSVSHLLFAVMTTVYILIAVQFEEHDLVKHYGDEYQQYRQSVSMIIPFPWKK